jgi:hypothetical protein
MPWAVVTSCGLRHQEMVDFIGQNGRELEHFGACWHHFGELNGSFPMDMFHYQRAIKN